MIQIEDGLLLNGHVGGQPAVATPTREYRAGWRVVLTTAAGTRDLPEIGRPLLPTKEDVRAALEQEGFEAT